MDQVFAVRHVCEKYLAKGNDLFLKRHIYDTIDRHGLWHADAMGAWNLMEIIARS